MAWHFYNNSGAQKIGSGVALPNVITPVFPLVPGTSGSSNDVANKAWLAKVWVPARTPITSINWRTGGTSAGNFDIGIYDSSFNLLWSKGSTAFPATNTDVATTIASGSPASLTLDAGTYYLAYASDSTTATYSYVATLFYGAFGSGKGLVYSKTSSFPLPSTLSSPTEENTNSTTPKPLYGGLVI